MEDSHADAVVIGGGPAGTAAAGMLAKAGRNVVLVERERFPRHHVGESLLPATTLGVLEHLGAREIVESHGFVRKRGGTFIWGNTSEPWTFNFYRTGPHDHLIGDETEFLHSFQVERAVYDELLLRHVESLGVRVLEGYAVDDVELGDTKRVRVTGSGGEHEITAPFIVDGSGRRSRIAPQIGRRHVDPSFRNVAVYAYFAGGSRLPDPHAGNIVTAAFGPGWCWYIPLRNDLTSVGLVLDRKVFTDLRRTESAEEILARLVRDVPLVADLLGDTARSREPFYDRVRVELDYSYIHSQFHENGVFLAGDSACFIDPIFSSGVHLATYAGYLAAQAIDRTLQDPRVAHDAAQTFEDGYRREYMAFYRFLTSFYELHADPSSYFWQARKVLERPEGTDMDAFIAIVSGQATTDALFTAPQFRETIAHGTHSLATLVRRAAGQTIAESDIERAKGFMKPLHEGRTRLVEDGLVGVDESGHQKPKS